MLPSALRKRLGGISYYINNLFIANSEKNVGENSNVFVVYRHKKVRINDGAVVDSGKSIVAKDDRKKKKRIKLLNINKKV